LGNYGYEENYFYELQTIIGGTNLLTKLTNVGMKCWKRLDHLSTGYAKKLQAETGIRYEKAKELYAYGSFFPIDW
jgi:hypothetical protein